MFLKSSTLSGLHTAFVGLSESFTVDTQVLSGRCTSLGFITTENDPNGP